MHIFSMICFVSALNGDRVHGFPTYLEPLQMLTSDCMTAFACLKTLEHLFFSRPSILTCYMNKRLEVIMKMLGNDLMYLLWIHIIRHFI